MPDLFFAHPGYRGSTTTSIPTDADSLAIIALPVTSSVHRCCAMQPEDKFRRASLHVVRNNHRGNEADTVDDSEPGFEPGLETFLLRPAG